MSTIQKIGLTDFERLLEAWKPRRKINACHVHHTCRPRHADFRGLATIEAMRRYHTQHAGLSDLAQHITIDPSGGLWTGRPFDMPPASVRGHNGTHREGPFMIEMIGDFDTGEDRFQAPQKEAAYAVIVAVLRKFGITKTKDEDKKEDKDKVLFHNEFSPQSCPGTGIDQKKFRDDINALLAKSRTLPERSDAVLDEDSVRNWHGGAERTLVADEVGEPEFAEIPEDPWMLEQQAFLAEMIAAGESARDIQIGPNDPLLRHVVNLSKGVLSNKGAIGTTRGGPTQFSSLRLIVEQHLTNYIEARKQKGEKPHLVFYAHGGLVNEESALCYARTILPWWLAHGVYPIFFVWESGLLETLRDKPRAARGPVSDFTDFLVEGLAQGLARDIWRQIKTDSENASRAQIPELGGQAGGAFQLADMLKPLLIKHPELGIHAIGHSTGPILLSKLMPLLIGGSGRIFDTLSYLAPAIRIDRFKERVLQPLLQENNRKVKELTIYTMTKAAEREDSVAGIYRKSLLYFVRNACDDINDGRILGLEEDIFGDPDLCKHFGLDKLLHKLSFDKVDRIEFSPPRDADMQNPRTRALKHGDFDNDMATMTSVLKRILGMEQEQELQRTTHAQQFPSKDDFKKCNPDASGRNLVAAAACPQCGWNGGPGADRFGGGDGDGDDAEDAQGGGSSASIDSASAPSAAPRKGRRLALCVGIDSYRESPLSGCVNDSKRWAAELARLGFEVESCHNQDATRGTIIRKLRELIVSAQRGDERVFQYAGHGTQIEDVSGDEEDRFDEAFVPVDYHEGQLLIDDDFYNESLRLTPGATLTLFIDCCNSGTNSRFAPPRASRDGSAVVRFLPMSSAVTSRFKGLRRGMAWAPRVAERTAPPGVIHFAACRDDEYAYEDNGQGDFTRLASPLLGEALRGRWSNAKFMETVVDKFGSGARQHPLLLDPAEGLRGRILLGGRGNFA